MRTTKMPAPMAPGDREVPPAAAGSPGAMPHHCGAPAAEARLDRLGTYELQEVLGCGGFAVVYRAYDPIRRRLVAIKVCDRHDRDARARFRREAAIGRFLAHPNLTRTYDFAADGETLYLVQEYLSGEDLAEIIRRREPHGLTRKLDVLVQVARALAHAHSRGVNHRDVKPSNVRVLEDGRVKVMDFGSAKRPGVDGLLTEVGMVVGTVAYMPPECLLGEPSTSSSDVWALGALAYELLAFRRPFDADRLPWLIDQILSSSPAPLEEVWAQCPSDLAQTVGRCLSKDPADRFASCADVAARLEEHRARIRPDRRAA